MKWTKKVRLLEKALGRSVKEVVKEEGETVVVQRRSLYVRKNIKSGQALKKSDLVELRPALGILPKHKIEVVGLTAKRNLSAGEPLRWNDLK